MFNPGRLSLARRRRGLTKKGLAELLGVTPLTILRYERGESTPPPENIAKLAKALAFPESFFFEPDIDEPLSDAASFRSMSGMSARQRDAALAAGSLAFVLTDWVEQRFELPAADLIDLSDERPDVAARSLRQRWGLGERPIKNMVHLLEAKGARVFSLAENTRTIDAFSLWHNENPYVFLNVMKSSERSRFDAAHELGHLLLHRHGGPKGRGAEDEANKFAMSFLMPESDVLAVIPRVHTLNQIVRAKRRWAVSVMALLYRLAKLEVLSDWQYRRLCIQATRHGYRETEPYSVKREQSILWHKVLTALWKERTTKNDIAAALHISPREIENLLFGIAPLLSIEGNGTGKIKGNAPPLRLVN